MPEKPIVDATPDDLPEIEFIDTPEEASHGGFNAARRPGQGGRTVDQILAARRSGGRSGSAGDVLANARAARQRAEATLARVRSRQGGVVPARASGSALSNATAEVHLALADMRAENELHQRDTRRGRADPVRAATVRNLDNRVNQAIVAERSVARYNQQSAATGAMARQIDRQARQIRALRTGPYGGDGDLVDAQGRRISARGARSIKAINAYMRRGDVGEISRIHAALTTREDTGGGFFLPEEWDRTLSRLLKDMSVMRQVATVRQTASPIVKMAKNLGGAGADWIGETTSPSETDTSTVAQLEFTVMELAALPKATQQMLEDADTNLELWIAEEVQEAFTDKENTAFIEGTGSNQPRGLLSYNFTANATYEAAPATYWGRFGYIATGVSGGWAASDPSDVFLDMEAALRPGYRAGASWLVNRPLVTEIRKMKDGDGNYLWQKGDITQGKPATLLSYPIWEDDYMPVKAANSYSLGFGDWAKTYLILDRLGSTVLRDPYTAKPYVAFYTRKRVGGGVKEFQSAKFLKFGAS